MKLSPQEQKIINILSDFRPHCLAVECYMKDDRARISALKKKGFMFEEVGNCHNPDHRHASPLKLRKLLNNPIGSTIPPKMETTPSVANLSPRTIVHYGSDVPTVGSGAVNLVNHQLGSIPSRPTKTFCCTSYWNGKPHDPKCYVPKQIRQTNGQMQLL